MKWMGWGPDDLASADPDLVEEIVHMINEEAEALNREDR